VATLLSGLSDSVPCRSIALFEATADALVEIGREGSTGSFTAPVSIPYTQTEHPAVQCLLSGRHVIEEHLVPWWGDGTILPGAAALLPFEGRLGADPTRSSLASHLLWIDAPNPFPMPSSLLDFLISLTGQGGVLLTGYRFRDDLRKTYEALHLANQKLQKDIDRARRIQEGLVPRGNLQAPNILATSRYQPAEKVSGDSFDLFPLSPEDPQGKQCLLIADVSGHGISAAMVMAMFNVLLRRSLRHTASPEKALAEVNQELLDQVRGLHFVTVFLAVFDPSDWSLRWVSAGHCPQLLLRKNGETVSLEASGLFLGCFDQPDLSTGDLVVAPGDRLLLHTDGITEAANPDGDMFNYDRLVASLQTHAKLSPSDTLDAVQLDLHSFIQESPLEDDLTLFLAEFQ
jgi:serine phosphatase RsbU (regulator of sigma subunit)